MEKKWLVFLINYFYEHILVILLIILPFVLITDSSMAVCLVTRLQRFELCSSPESHKIQLYILWADNFSFQHSPVRI